MYSIKYRAVEGYKEPVAVALEHPIEWLHAIGQMKLLGLAKLVKGTVVAVKVDSVFYLFQIIEDIDLESSMDKAVYYVPGSWVRETYIRTIVMSEPPHRGVIKCKHLYIPTEAMLKYYEDICTV